MEIIGIYNQEQVSDEEAKKFRTRYAVRGIVKDEMNRVAIFHHTKTGTYGLPGGGVEGQETPEQAVIRECREEIACEVRVLRGLARTIEYRKRKKMLYDSTAYLAELVGEKGVPVPQDSELTHGSVVIWVSIDEAITLLESIPLSTKRDFLYDNYIIQRDLSFLKAAFEFF